MLTHRARKPREKQEKSNLKKPGKENSDTVALIVISVIVRVTVIVVVIRFRFFL